MHSINKGCIFSIFIVYFIFTLLHSTWGCALFSVSGKLFLCVMSLPVYFSSGDMYIESDNAPSSSSRHVYFPSFNIFILTPVLLSLLSLFFLFPHS